MIVFKLGDVWWCKDALVAFRIDKLLRENAHKYDNVVLKRCCPRSQTLCLDAAIDLLVLTWFGQVDGRLDDSFCFWGFTVINADQNSSIVSRSLFSAFHLLPLEVDTVEDIGFPKDSCNRRVSSEPMFVFKKSR